MLCSGPQKNPLMPPIQASLKLSRAHMLFMLVVPFQPCNIHLRPHSIRHSLPSEDAGTGNRKLDAIQRRGRWRMPASVRRYAKDHVLLFAQQRTPPHLLEEGRELIKGWGERPAVAR